MRFSLLTALAGVCVCSALAAGVPRTREALAALPLYFEANQGQWAPGVLFEARSGSYSVSLTRSGARVASAEGRRISVSFVNANRRPLVRGTDPLASHSNYFVGPRKNWRTGVPHFGRVRYQGVYPGIDVVYYGSPKHLEYDLVLQPGADPGRIAIAFGGATRLELTPEGDLAVETAGARFVQKRPYIYQGTRQVDGRYRLLARNVAGIEVAAYDRSLPLTVDPVLVYSSLLGGQGADEVTAVKIDPAGMIYAAGYVTTGSLASTDGTTQNADSSDAFVAKIDPTAAGGASIVYFSYLGGTKADVVTAMALDGSGNIYLTGTTYSSDYPTVGSAFQTSLGAGTERDAFVAKIQPGRGDLVYSSFLGGKDIDEGHGIDVDRAGKIYVTGTTRSSDFPTTSSGYATQIWEQQDSFVAKIDPDASPSLVYSTFLGGELSDDGRSIAVAPDGTVYVAGSTVSTLFPIEGGNSYRTSLQGGVDIFLAHMDLTKSGTASMPYSTYIGGSGLEEVRKIVVDAEGKVVLTGYTLSDDFPVTADALRPKPGGNGDAFVLRFDASAAPDAAVLYGTYFGGSGGDVAQDVAVDAKGVVYIAGYTLSADLPVTPDTIQPEYNNGVEAFVARLDLAARSTTFCTYLGKDGIHVASAVAVGPDGTMVAGGLTPRQDVYATDGAVQPTYSGGLSDGFVVVIQP